MKIEKQVNWRLFARNRRYLLYTIGIGLLGFLLVVRGIIPLISLAFSTNDEFAKKNKLANQLAVKVDRLQELNTDEMIARQGLVNQVLPSRKPVLELLTGLNIAAGDSGVVFTDFQVSPGEIATDAASLAALAKKKNRTDESYDTLVVKLTAEGTFAQVQEFLRQVELLAPLTTVTDLNLSIKRKQNGVVQQDDDASAELMLSTYFYTQSLSAAISAPLPTLNNTHEQVLSQLETFTYPTFEQQQQIISDGVLDLFGISQDFAELETAESSESASPVPQESEE